MIFSDTILRICNEQASVRCAAKPEPNMMITPLLLSLWNKPTTSGFPDDVLRGGICGEQLPRSVPIRGLGVPLVNVKRIHDEAHPTLPRFGTDRGSQLYHLVEA